MPEAREPTDIPIRVPRTRRAPLSAILRRVGLAFLLVVFVAVVAWAGGDGYVDTATGDPVGFLDAMYYASVTVTTTVYGDITAVSDGSRLATILLITPARIVFLILVVGTTVEVLTDQTREYLAARRWRRSVHDHMLICGYGSTGRSAAAELIKRGATAESIVVVDTDPGALAEAGRAGHVAIQGDATQSAVLEQAEIRSARTVIVAPNRDDTAVLITLTARELNAHAHIVAGGREQENLHLLRQGGADEVIDATAAVGRMIGLAATSPGAVRVVDDLLDSGTGLDLHEVVWGGDETPRLVDGDSVVAVIRDGRTLRAQTYEIGDLAPGDRVIVMSQPSEA